MHAAFFGIKRVHWCVVGMTQSFLPKGLGMTPARFDMMRIVELHRLGAAQGKIQDLLGVSAPTVSRMLKSLEALGYVMRERMEHDRRQRRVFLTRLGLERVRAARLKLVESGGAERLVRHGLGFKSQPKVKTLRRYLSKMRERYVDRALFEEPWTLKVLTFLEDGTLAYRPPLVA